VSAPEPLGLDALTDALVRLVRDDELAGRVVVLRGGEPPRLLAPDEAR